jgi:molybdopterin/thiamine biosynthesis adenylyltransferase
MAPVFDYTIAFDRNIGWVTRAEQAQLAGKRIAIAGLGGVGGSHLLTLTRLGVGGFHLADFDRFELANFNRQTGARLSTLGREKVEVLAAMARDVNPELRLELWPQGVSKVNAEAFLEGVDLFVDGLDFFALQARREIFAECAKRRIPAVTAAPLGMGVSLLSFLPDGMSFEEYFRLEGQSEDEQLLRFLVGLSPAMLQGSYLVDSSAVDLSRRRGPSTPMACELCAGVAATEALKILLGRGRLLAAPWSLHFDAYRYRMLRKWRPGGNRNPLQRIALIVARRRFGSQGRPARLSEQAPKAEWSVAEAVLDLARWAPSPDNTQPWRFEVQDDTHLVVHGFDTRDRCVYDLEGRASQIAIGALLENIVIAASRYQRIARIDRRHDTPEVTPTFEVRLVPNSGVEPHPLTPFIPFRATQRRWLRMRPLTGAEKESLAASAGASWSLVWFESLGQRLRVARLLSLNAKLRLTMPEAYEVHKDIIEWNRRFSLDRIPDEALGLDRLTLRIMRWAMQSWERVRFLNTFLFGTWLPRLELDIIPALACAGHFVVLAPKPPRTLDDYVAAGRAVQRLWLKASRLALWIQPELTPLIFASYSRDGVRFSNEAASLAMAGDISRRLEGLLGVEASRRAVWMARIGAGAAPVARSLRLPLESLKVKVGGAPLAAPSGCGSVELGS